MLHKLRRSDRPFRKISYAGTLITLGRLEALYFDRLWNNRGYVINNEWAFQLLWPDVDRLELLAGKRLDMLVKTLREKMPGIIFTKHGVGRYVPAGSGLTIQRMGNARQVYVYVKAALAGTPVERPEAFNG